MTNQAKHCDLEHEHYPHCHGKRPCDCGMCNDQTKDQATKKPWKLIESFNKNSEITHFIKSGTPSTCRVIAGILTDNLRLGSNEANARLIVKCVNMHDELINALKAMVFHYGDCTIQCQGGNIAPCVHKMAKQALQKAGEL